MDRMVEATIPPATAVPTELRAAAPAYEKAEAAERTPLMPLIVDAVRARATVGEISDAFRSVWGEYRPA